MANRVLLLLLMLGVSSLQTKGQTFTIASYNCENAFDTLHDAGKEDYDFLPGGTHHWTRHRMYTKLNGIAKVIASVDSLRPVDVVCLCEVENDSVMTWLTERTVLHRMGYRYVMTHSLDERGVDVALLYQPFTFHLLYYNSIRPQIEGHTRDVLHATGTIASGDTLDVFAVHLPSKLKGKTSEGYRKTIARQIMHAVDSLEAVRTQPNVVVLGDFNDEANTPTLRNFTKGGRLESAAVPSQQKKHSYKYQGVWSGIDHILVNKNMKRRLVATDVVSHSFLLEEDQKFGGVKPKRTFVGWKYNGGFSDHLPIVASFDITAGFRH